MRCLFQFDSGGPMVTSLENRWYITGIVLSEFCGSEEYSVFTEITAFQDWLTSIYDGKIPESK